MRRHTDVRGLPVTAVGRSAVEALDRAVESYLSSAADTAERVEETLLADPGMPLAHCLQGYLLMLAGLPETVARAPESADRARRLAEGATDRERLHAAALTAWSARDLRSAIDRLEEILLDHPRDILAFRIAHYLHFFIGDIVPMRDSAARIMPRWDEDVSGFGYLLGCRAFGLEETGDYEAAERAGRRAVEINERDIWAGHAVAHVLEMQGRPREGLEWVRQHEAVWKQQGRFVNHIHWHRSLYWLELGQNDAALDQFDRLIWPSPSDDNLDLVNAASLLMRLEMAGVQVGRRWETIAEVATRRIGFHDRPFNDVHLTMAMMRGGRREPSARMLRGMRDYGEAGKSTVAPFVREIGVPLSEAIAAYTEAEFGRAVDLMMPIRYGWRVLGGSWAQRDVFQRMLIDAAIASGQIPLARALLAERLAIYPRSASAWHLYGKVLAKAGEQKGAGEARDTADRLRANEAPIAAQ